MIEVKLSFTTIVEMLGFFGCSVPAAAVVDTSSATVTPEKQQAARDSTAAGKVAKAEKPVKADKTPVEALKETVEKEKAETPTPRVYETSGLPEKVAKAVTKNRDAVVALLEKYEAKKDGKMSAKFLAAEHFDAFEAGIDAVLAPAEDLG